ncbi:hypothetical protein E1287_00755 [Actinomadura sp. KC06]|nr:hypothetical protein E1287_00755 [Actinomadura sp. KC06]
MGDATLRAALDAGVTLIDTAIAYGTAEAQNSPVGRTPSSGAGMRRSSPRTTEALCV